jgi:hypothetical protein
VSRPASPTDEEVAKDAAHSGNAASTRDYRYRLIDPGAGPRPLPSWLSDAQVRWHLGWSNRPEVEFCFSRDPLAVTTYRKDLDSGDAWLGANPEGDCFQTHWHDGTPRPTEFERNVGWDTPDGAYARGATIRKEPYTMLATPSQKGYAGRSFDITMADDSPLWPGEIVRLRGPWHLGTGRPGCVSVVGVVWDERARVREAAAAPRHRRGWRGATKCFGYIVRERVVVDALATFLPHLPIAEVESAPDRAGKTRRWVEPCLPQTGAPRHMTDAQRVDSLTA